MAENQPAGATRPIEATILALMGAVVGAFAALFGLLVMLGAAGPGGLAGLILGITLILIALPYLAMAYGVWLARGWSWTLGSVVAVLTLFVAVIGLMAGISLTTILAAGLPTALLWLLWRPKVKRYLGRPAGGPYGQTWWFW